MSSIVLQNSTVVVPETVGVNVALFFEDEFIAAVSSDKTVIDADERLDCSDVTIVPGFIDIHIHGAVGIDVNETGVEGLLRIAEFLAQNGVTAWMPTLVPDSDENYQRAIDAIDQLMSIQADRPVAQAVGVHYEGVFASEKMCGALRPQFFKSYSGAPTTPSAEAAATPPQAGGELLELPRLKNGIHMTTLAPEVEGGIALVEELVKQGWVVSIGHTKADAGTLERAFAAGARHLTHFFNAMTGMHHREIGVAGWGLAKKDVTFDIIADGVHVHPTMVEVACRSKTADKVSLISDSVAPTGLGDGEYKLWGETISVKNGRTKNERGSISGSVSTMLDGAKMMRLLGFSDVEVAKMASTNPANLLGLDGTRGSIEIGKRADLVGIDADGNIAFTMIGGKIIQRM